jgi:glutamate decarboxylase
LFHTSDSEEIYDIGDLTPQCGRRGDALKFYLAWLYYGKSGLSNRIATAYSRAEYLFSTLTSNSNFTMVSQTPLPCLQVCFYYTPDNVKPEEVGKERMSRRTEDVASGLVGKGWMIDYAPGEMGKFFRVVVNAGTEEESLRRLVECIEDVGREVVRLEKS